MVKSGITSAEQNKSFTPRMHTPNKITDCKTKIAVTGANGYIGQRLCLELANRGHPVIALVRRSNTAPKHPNIQERVTNYTTSACITNALEGARTLIHLIAKTHARDCPDKLDQYLSTNVELTKTLALAAVKAGVPRLIFLSSIKVNGESTTSPFNQNSIPDPTTAYGLSKWEAEQTLRQIQQQTSLTTTIIRCPLVYSPEAPGNIQALRKAILKGIPLPLGSINNRRDLIDLKSLCEYLVECCDNDRFDNQTLLISNNEPLSTPQLVQKLAQDLNRSARILPFPVTLLKLIFTCLGKKEALAKLCDNLEVTSDIHCNNKT